MPEDEKRPGKQVWIDRFEPLEVWRFVFRAENLLLAFPLIFLYSFLLGSYYTGGFIMVARSALAIYSTLGLLFCYLFIILDYTARGYQAPPKLSGDLLTTNKMRFIKSLAIISLFASLLYTTANSPVAFICIAIMTLLFLPVTFCIIAIQDNFLNALNPLHWVFFFRNIQLDQSVLRYITALSLVLFSGYLLTLNLSWFNALSVSCTVLSLMVLFRALGVVVHTHAANLGLSVRFGPEVEARQRAEAQRRDLSDFAKSLYEKVEVHRTKEAFADYEEKITEAQFEPEDDLWQIITKWANSDLAILAGAAYVERLLKQNREREAWTVLLFCFEKNQSEYRLNDGDTTLKMAEHALTNKERRVSAELLRYFDKDFSSHPAAGEALLKAAELLLVDANDSAGAKKLLSHIRIKFPDLARQRPYQALDTALKNS